MVFQLALQRVDARDGLFNRLSLPQFDFCGQHGVGTELNRYRIEDRHYSRLTLDNRIDRFLDVRIRRSSDDQAELGTDILAENDNEL